MVLAGCVAALAGAAGQSWAAFGVVQDSYAVTFSSSQAGGHGDVTTALKFNTVPAPDPPYAGGAKPDEEAKDLVVNLPAGLVGDPQAFPQCSADALGPRSHLGGCPPDTQVGVLHYRLTALSNTFAVPIFNMVPQNGRPAEFGFFNLSLIPAQIHLLASVRTGGDYGITVTVPEIPGALTVSELSATFWGTPADPSHDAERGSYVTGGCLGPNGPTGSLCPSHAPPKAFLSNPTQCDTATTTTLTADSWEHPGDFIPPLASAPLQFTGCDKLSFEPTLTLQPESRKVGEPSGYTVDLHVPQTDSPTALATPHVKKVTVTLPEGVTVSPSAANGLAGCTDAQIGLDNAADPTCPDASKIGTVKVVTPLLPDPLEGSVYQGTQTPDHLLRLFIAAKAHGVLVKLPGSVDLNPDTGQITTTVDNAPQLPFEDFILKFDGGSLAPLSNPRTCGEKTTSATISSWAGNVVNATDSFTISGDGNGAPCTPFGFSPSFEAGVVNPVAGKSSTFTLTFGRDDADQELRALSVSMPRGLLAKVAGVPLCPAAAATAGTCGEASRIGSVTTTAGPGSQPFSLPGRVYLTGPLHGAPFGLSIVVPAKAGPLDLGTVVVTAAIEVRNNGSLRVVSDPLPTILDGIPLQIRSVNVTIGRPGFMVNPTSCSPTRVAGTIGSLEGSTANVSSRFQLLDCGRLPFHPDLAIRVGRRGHTHAGGSTPLTATLTQTPGQAGVHTVKVVLPSVFNALLPAVSDACALTVFKTDASGCPSISRVGIASAVTPLLAHALRGTVYFVKNPKRAIPDLMVALRGQIAIDLTGKISLPGGGKLLATTFDSVPDVPIKRFTMKLFDGANGPVGVVRNLCSRSARRSHVQIGMRGQNGKLVHVSQRLRVSGC